MPDLLRNPPAADRLYYVRAPKLPPRPEELGPPLRYTEADFEEACRGAREEGRIAAQASYEEARREYRAQSLEQAEALRRVAAAVAGQRRVLMAEAGERIMELSRQIALKVIRREIADRPQTVVPLVRELLRRAAAADTLIVRLSPRDHAYLVSGLGSLPELGGMPGLKWRADESIADGGAVLETESGAWDGTLETQLDRVAAALAPPEE